MPKLKSIPTIVRELVLNDHFERVQEPDLVMEDPEQIEAFEMAGRTPGALNGLYIYHAARCSRVISGAKNVLDLGCGPGVPLIKLARLNPDIQFTGLDLSEEMLEKARANAVDRGLTNISFRMADITELSDFSDHSFDAVTSMQAFHHLPTMGHLEQTFQQVARVLKPDGAIYFQDLSRLKSRHSTVHFAYYDPNQPLLTQIDGERSMRAAFLHSDYVELTKKYLPQASVFKTALVELYTVVATKEREISEDLEQRIKSMEKSLDKESRQVHGDVKLLHRMGGFK